MPFDLPDHGGSGPGDPHNHDRLAAVAKSLSQVIAITADLNGVCHNCLLAFFILDCIKDANDAIADGKSDAVEFLTEFRAQVHTMTEPA